MADAWGGSWGSSWGASWGDVASSAEEVRQPGGGYVRPIIYLDDKGRPVDLKKYKARLTNEVTQAATAAVKELPKDERPEAREAIKDLRAAIATNVAGRVAEQAETLRGMVGDLRGLLTELEAAIEAEAEEDDIAVLLLM